MPGKDSRWCPDLGIEGGVLPCILPAATLSRSDRASSSTLRAVLSSMKAVSATERPTDALVRVSGHVKECRNGATRPEIRSPPLLRYGQSGEEA